jgi:hypothetical protein
MQDVMQGAFFFSENAPTRLDHPVLAAVHQYWSMKRGDRLMPARADIDPLELRDYLGWIVIMDVLEDGADFRYRLVGTKVTHYFGADGSGRTISECFASLGTDVVRDALDVHRRVVWKRQPLRVYGEVPLMAHQRGVFDSLHMPLSDDGETANMLISAFTFDYKDVKSGNTLLL